MSAQNAFEAQEIKGWMNGLDDDGFLPDATSEIFQRWFNMLKWDYTVGDDFLFQVALAHFSHLFESYSSLNQFYDQFNAEGFHSESAENIQTRLISI